MLRLGRCLRDLWARVLHGRRFETISSGETDRGFDKSIGVLRALHLLQLVVVVLDFASRALFLKMIFRDLLGAASIVDVFQFDLDAFTNLLLVVELVGLVVGETAGDQIFVLLQLALHPVVFQRPISVPLAGLLDQLSEMLQSHGSIEQPPKMEGRTMTMILVPLKQKQSQREKEGISKNEESETQNT